MDCRTACRPSRNGNTSVEEGQFLKPRALTTSIRACSKTDLTPAPTNDLSSTQANFDGNHPMGSAAKGPYVQHPSQVGLYLPNPLGIYDLHGNVWEWTSSQEGSGRVLRGGSWYNKAENCSAANRGSNEPGHRYSTSASASSLFRRKQGRMHDNPSPQPPPRSGEGE